MAGLVAFDSAALTGFPVGLQRYLFRRAIERIVPVGDITYAALDRVTAFARDGKGSGAFRLNAGIRLFREAGQIFVAGDAAVLPFERWPQLSSDADSIPLDAPCHVELPGGWRFNCELWNIPALAQEQMQDNEDPFQVWLDADKLQGALSLRIRRDGDRFEPLGMDGHSQKMSDFFTNVKLPAARPRALAAILRGRDNCLGSWLPTCPSVSTDKILPPHSVFHTHFSSQKEAGIKNLVHRTRFLFFYSCCSLN